MTRSSRKIRRTTGYDAICSWPPISPAATPSGPASSISRFWPSVLVTESPLGGTFDEYVRVTLFLIRQGDEAGEWAAGPDAYETAAILNGSTDQLIITALPYRRPGNLTAATASILDRTMGFLFQPLKAKHVATKWRAKKTA